MANSNSNTAKRNGNPKGSPKIIEENLPGLPGGPSLEEVNPPDQVIDAVIIQVVRHPNGKISPVIAINGDVRITEVPEILRQAQKAYLASQD